MCIFRFSCINVKVLKVSISIKYYIKNFFQFYLKEVNELKKIFGYTTLEAIGHKTHKANIRRGGQQQQAQECVHQ